eukprot:TRINITY_DN14303_c0_g2_i1.p1 TRINITY_DN14303_c0_g2~~TRINITY_DN14303_c0_g2_i1.p1  ORF type:complete len:267 (-),score=36.17 TRINITY_DN14303_c0_g2_i1:52-852(-)
MHLSGRVGGGTPTAFAWWWPWSSSEGAPKSTIGDLEAVDKLVAFINDVTKQSYEQVVQDFKDTQRMRIDLEDAVRAARDELLPKCTAYADTRKRLMIGGEGESPAMNAMLLAQGKALNMALLGQKVYGCVDTCASDALGQSPGPCDLGKCRSTLAGVRKIEEILGSSEWNDKDNAARRACASSTKNELVVQRPAGWDATYKEIAAEEAALNADEADAVTEQCVPRATAALLVCSLGFRHPLEQRRPRKAASRCGVAAGPGAFATFL